MGVCLLALMEPTLMSLSLVPSAERTPFPLFLFLLPSCQRVTTTLVYAELEQNAIGGPQVKAILSNVLAFCR